MFYQLFSTLDNETPFFHTPLSVKKDELRNIKEWHIVYGYGAYWKTTLEIDEKIEKDEIQYTAPWVLPHFSISLSYWNPKKKELQFILAVYEKRFLGISDICSLSSLDNWEIVQSYIKKDEEKRDTDGIDFLVEHVFSIFNSQ
jgi:hypothetical protein